MGSFFFVILFWLQHTIVRCQLYIPFNWTTSSTPLPFAFDSTAIGSDGNNIWFIGGEDTSFRALNTIYKFNLLNQSFNEPPLIIQSKVEISGQSFVELDNVIYFVHNAPSSDSLFIHALDMDTYTTSSYTAIDKLPSDPEFIFSSPCLAAYPNKVFVIGGGCGSICSNYATHILTLNTMDWTLGPDLNERRAAHSCSISNGKIYAIGGTGVQDSMTTIEKWDFINDYAADSWTIISPILNPGRRSHRSISILDGIIIAGGWTEDTELRTLNNVDLLHTRGNEYIEALTPMNELRGTLGLILVGYTIYAFGGYSTDIHDELITYESTDISPVNLILPTKAPTFNANTLEPTYAPTINYSEPQNLTGLEWTAGTTLMPEERSLAFAAYNSKTEEIWILGGRGSSFTSYNSILTMDINTNIFITSTEVMQNALRSSAQCWTQIDDIIYYINYAPTSDNDYLHAINMSDYRTSITFISTIPDTSAGYALSSAGCMTSFDNKLYIVGGGAIIGNYYGTLIYDIDDNIWSYGPELIEYRSAHSCNIVDGAIYAIGGTGIQEYIASIEKWDFINNKYEESFEAIYPILNPGRDRHRSIGIGNGRILITGGWSETIDGDLILLDSVDLLHTRSNPPYIQSLPSLNKVRGDHILLQINDYFMVIGGYGGGSTYYSDWEITNPLPTASPTMRPTTAEPTEIPSPMPINTMTAQPTQIMQSSNSTIDSSTNDTNFSMKHCRQALILVLLIMSCTVLA